MVMASTYEPIATSTLGSAASSITFSSIPSTYTDLRLVFIGTVSADTGAYITFNSDSGSNYSFSSILGSGASAGAQNRTDQTSQWLYYYGNMSSTVPTFVTTDIFSYTGSTFKSSLSTKNGDFNGSGSIQSMCSMWRNTSAINRIDIYSQSGTFSIGTRATLYGIKAA